MYLLIFFDAFPSWKQVGISLYYQFCGIRISDLVLVQGKLVTIVQEEDEDVTMLAALATLRDRRKQQNRS